MPQLKSQHWCLVAFSLWVVLECPGLQGGAPMANPSKYILFCDEYEPNYGPGRMGHNPLDDFVKKLSKLCKIEPHYTNYSLRVTGGTTFVHKNEQLSVFLLFPMRCHSRGGQNIFHPTPTMQDKQKWEKIPPPIARRVIPPPQTQEDSKPFSQTSVRERELIFHGKWSPRGLMSPNPRSNLDSIYGLRLTSFLVCPEMGRLHKLRRKMCTVWYGQWIGVRIGMKKIDLRLGTKCTRWYEK